MSFRDLLVMVWENLGRMKARVAMTAIGVLIGTTAVVVLVSLAAGLQRSVTGELGSIGDLTQIRLMPGSFVQAFGAPSPAQARDVTVINDRLLAEIRGLPGVVAVTPQQRLMGGATIELNRLVAGIYSLIGIDPAVVERMGWEMASGSAHLGTGQVLAGAKVGESFWDPRLRGGEASPLETDLQGQTLRIVLTRPTEGGQPAERRISARVIGVLAERGGEEDQSLYFTLRDMQDMNEWLSGHRLDVNREGYQGALVKVDSPERVVAVEQEILDMGLFAFSPHDALRSINTIFLILQAIFAGIGGIALLVAAFGIANTMIMAIYERTREIGLMKAIGATNRDVMTVFLAEAAAIGLLGGVLGVMVGILLSQIVNLFALSYLSTQTGGLGPSFVVYTPPWLILLSLAFATFVGLLSGIYPAMRAATLNPVSALKYE